MFHQALLFALNLIFFGKAAAALGLGALGSQAPCPVLVVKKK